MAKVMVVDDNPGIVVLVERILKMAGHEAIKTSGGEDALIKLETEKPDLILLDIMMPRLDGWQTLRRIREFDGMKNVPVAMLTAKKLTAETTEREELEELVDYIQKPFTKNKLIEKVNSILENIKSINNKNAVLSSTMDKDSIKEYQFTVKNELLYGNVIETLKENLERTKAPYELEVIKEAIESQESKIANLIKRREEIEKKIMDAHK